MTAPARSLTIGGLPGTGTTTACTALQTLTGLPYVYAGEIFRKMAKERGLTLAEFGSLAERDASIDRDLDDRQAKLLAAAPVLLEGRLSGYLAYRDRVPAFKVWFTCDPYERARRVVEREGGDLETRMEEMRRREQSERKRYLEYYAFDVSDLSVYDLVIDTTKLPRESITARVREAYEKASRARRWWWPFA